MLATNWIVLHLGVHRERFSGIVVVAVFMLAVTVVLLLQAAVRVCLLGTKSVREYKTRHICCLVTESF